MRRRKVSLTLQICHKDEEQKTRRDGMMGKKFNISTTRDGGVKIGQTVINRGDVRGEEDEDF